MPLLKSAVAALNGNDLVTAREAMAAARRAAPNHPQVLYLEGNLAKAEGRLADAEAAFRQSLAADPRQPQVHHSLGALFARRGDRAAAREAFARAVAIEPRYAEAQLNLARMALATGALAQADAALDAYRRLKPGDFVVETIAAQIALKRSDAALALDHCARVPARAPAHATAQRLRARALGALGQLDEAVELLERLLGAAPQDEGLRLELARAAYEAGRAAQAESLLEAVITARPNWVEAQRDLSQIRYMASDPDFLRGWHQGIDAAPDNANLLVSFAYTAAAGGQAAAARPVLEAALARGMRSAAVESALGHVLGELGDLDGAVAHQEAAFAQPDRDITVVQNYTAAMLTARRPEAALEGTRLALARDPADQLALAYEVTAHHLQKDPSAKGLFDVETFTDQREIACPEGYDSVAAFNAELATELTALHRAAREPLEQSLRGGTQVELSNHVGRSPILGLLVKALKDNVRAFIARLPDDPNHPFLRRKPDAAEFNGIWSVRLRSGGRHVSHAHPEGWLSSCYYVTLPPVVESGEGREGWLALGAPPLKGLADEIPAVVKQPATGSLILFPSYFWHGTIPFKSEIPRLTVAFDVIGNGV
jgi:tetratricopeptide (TPR) repeat protein